MTNAKVIYPLFIKRALLKKKGSNPFIKYIKFLVKRAIHTFDPEPLSIME